MFVSGRGQVAPSIICPEDNNIIFLIVWPWNPKLFGPLKMCTNFSILVCNYVIATVLFALYFLITWYIFEGTKNFIIMN